LSTTTRNLSDNVNLFKMVKDRVDPIFEPVAEGVLESTRGDYAIVGFEILVRVEPVRERDYALATGKVPFLVADILFESVSVVGIAGTHCVVWWVLDHYGWQFLGVSPGTVREAGVRGAVSGISPDNVAFPTAYSNVGAV